ncbi:MAG: tetratricopeptide repeat protein [Planctomycetota bacterium]
MSALSVYAGAITMPQVVLAGFLVFVVLTGCSATSLPPAALLPPGAQSAFQRGLDAGEQNEWGQAVGYFSEAWEAAPASPQVLFNLAESYDRLGRHEVQAIVWYQAYLAVEPDVPGNKEVRERIKGLEADLDASIKNLIRMAKEAAARVADDEERSKVYRNIALDESNAGDAAAARETFLLAREAAAEIPDTEERCATYQLIVAEQVKAGDIAGARETLTLALESADRITDDYQSVWAYPALAGALVEVGEIDRALEAAAKIPDDKNKAFAYSDIALAQAKAGDVAGARQSIALAREALAQVPEGDDITGVYVNIAEAQAKAGDMAGAMETAALIRDEYYKVHAYGAIAVIQGGPAATEAFEWIESGRCT